MVETITSPGLRNSGGFRQGHKFGFFDSKLHFSETLNGLFDRVHVGERNEKYPDIELGFYFAQIRV